ncbi:hypothetical protein Tco_0914750 [Tanacetum coccineum]
MVVVVVDVQIRLVDVESEVVVMDLKDPVANYPWLKHEGCRVVFVVVKVLEERMKRFDRSSYLKWILMVLEVVKEFSFLEVEKVFIHCGFPHLRIQGLDLDEEDDGNWARLDFPTFCCLLGGGFLGCLAIRADILLGFREVEVYTETGVSLVERHVIGRMTSKGKGVLMEEIEDVDVNDAIGKEFDDDIGKVIDHEFGMDTPRMDDLDIEQEMEEILYYDIDDGASISGKSGDVPTWFSDQDVDQGIDVECQDDPYHIVDEPQEISDMFANIDQAFDELDQIFEAQDVSELFSIYDQLIDAKVDVVPVDLVAEEHVEEEAFDGDEGEEVFSDGEVIPHEVYDVMVAHEGVLYAEDGDVIPTEVYDAMVAQEMLEDQTRAIKRRRVMADKEDEDDAQ